MAPFVWQSIYVLFYFTQNSGFKKEFSVGVQKPGSAKGDEVMSHGGITIDEVIVPFIKIKAVDNNG